MTQHNKNPLLHMPPFHIDFNFYSETNDLLHKENAGYLLKPAGPQITYFRYSVDEMPQELYSCLCQLACRKIGFITSLKF